MSRSLKKGPFIDPKLEAKVVAQAEGNKKSVIKTWSRASMISPDFVGQTIAVAVKPRTACYYKNFFFGHNFISK